MANNTTPNFTISRELQNRIHRRKKRIRKSKKKNSKLNNNSPQAATARYVDVNTERFNVNRDVKNLKNLAKLRNKIRTRNKSGEKTNTTNMTVEKINGENKIRYGEETYSFSSQFGKIPIYKTAIEKFTDSEGQITDVLGFVRAVRDVMKLKNSSNLHGTRYKQERELIKHKMLDLMGKIKKGLKQ